jgi:hypothetical protein
LLFEIFSNIFRKMLFERKSARRAYYRMSPTILLFLSMKRIRTSALVAAVMIGSAAFAASVSADSSNVATDRHPPRISSASGSSAIFSGTGLTGAWQ